MTDERLEAAAVLLSWFRSTGRRVWADPATGLQFDDEYGIAPEMAARLLEAHDTIVLLLKVEALLERIGGGAR